ncbi:MAG: DUF554 domain-containing protein [Eubacterium sp.]|nr:DUF554 domain-containing protein [Eubacterium sp.]
MPIGILINSCSIAVGGILGAITGGKLSDNFKEKLNMIFGVCAMGMGISSIVLMENMPAVIFSVILGTIAGISIHLGDKINQVSGEMQRIIGKFVKTGNNEISEDEFMDTMVTVIVLFCASGTGIYGSLISGMNGDHSILIAKSILDLFTALIFACILGIVVSAIAIPQFIVFLLLFLLAKSIYPLTTPEMINDFKACDGLIMLATGFRMIKVKMFPTADMIPAMILVMPCSWIWGTYILPLIS